MTGIRIKADEEGVKLLNTLAGDVDDSIKDITEQASQLLEDISGNPALGPHKDAIIKAVEEIIEETKGTTAPAEVVTERLRKKAEEYQEWINDDLFGDGGK